MKDLRSWTRSTTLVIAFLLCDAGLHPARADEVLVANGDWPL